jgi:hypothetical protein
MSRLLCLFSVGLLFAGNPLTSPAQSNPFAGVYAGEMRTCAASTGCKPLLYPARLTLLPNGKSIIITEQLQNSVATTVIEGAFKGNIFEGFSRGRFNPPNYIWSARYRIRFSRNQARIEEAKGPHEPPGFKDNPGAKRSVFYRVRS